MRAIIENVDLISRFDHFPDAATFSFAKNTIYRPLSRQAKQLQICSVYVPVYVILTTWESMLGRQNDSNRGSVKSTTSSSRKRRLRFLDVRSISFSTLDDGSSASLSFFMVQPECIGDEQ